MADDRKIMVVSSIPPMRPRSFFPDGSLQMQWGDLSQLTWTSLRTYCAKHGYGFHGDVSDIWENVGSPWHGVAAPISHAPIRHFQKLRLMLHYMTPEKCREHWDYVVWLDADMVIGDYDTPLTKWTNTRGASSGDAGDITEGDLILPWDVNGLHPTVIMARATTQMRGLVWAMTEAGQRMFQLHDWSENLAFRFFTATPPYREALHWHSAKMLCAMPPGIHPLPPDVRSLYEYEDGASWALHLSALSIEMRMKLAAEFIATHPMP